MIGRRRPLCEEIEDQQFRVLRVLDTVAEEHSMTLKEIVAELERLRQRAADLQTAHDLRAAMAARRSDEVRQHSEDTPHEVEPRG